MAVAVDLVAVDVIPGERFQLRVKLRRPLLLLRIGNRVGVDQIQLESSFEDRTRETAPFPVLLASVLGDLSGFEFGGELLVVCHGCKSNTGQVRVASAGALCVLP